MPSSYTAVTTIPIMSRGWLDMYCVTAGALVISMRLIARAGRTVMPADALRPRYVMVSLVSVMVRGAVGDIA